MAADTKLSTRTLMPETAKIIDAFRAAFGSAPPAGKVWEGDHIKTWGKFSERKIEPRTIN